MKCLILESFLFPSEPSCACVHSPVTSADCTVSTLVNVLVLVLVVVESASPAIRLVAVANGLAGLRSIVVVA